VSRYRTPNDRDHEDGEDVISPSCLLRRCEERGGGLHLNLDSGFPVAGFLAPRIPQQASGCTHCYSVYAAPVDDSELEADRVTRIAIWMLMEEREVGSMVAEDVLIEAASKTGRPVQKVAARYVATHDLEP
jgi:hypothetical protein